MTQKKQTQKEKLKVGDKHIKQLTTVSERLQFNEISGFCVPSDEQKCPLRLRNRVKSPPLLRRSQKLETVVINKAE